MNILKTILISGGVLLASITLSTLTATEAHAATPAPHAVSVIMKQAVKAATSCGQAQCSLDSTARGESDWRTSYDGGGTGKPNPGLTASNNVYTYTGCSTWLPVGGGSSTRTYPATNSGTYNCDFADGGTFSGGTAITIYSCSPHSDRASNGRLNVYYKDPATGVKVFKYILCEYPTDAYAPIEKNVGSGKVYTGGQGDFFNTGGGSAQASSYGNTGSVVSSSGYINRGANLSNPEAWSGSWQPSFTASTGVNANGTPRYGFHRLQWTLDYRTCVKWAYPSWLNKPVRYDCSQRGQDRLANPYTYACNINPALQAGIIGGAKFVPAECASGWVCVISGNTTVGGIPNALTVMRNGEPNPVVYPSVGVGGSNIQSPRAWQVKNTVNAGSTPSLSYVKPSWSWDAWETYKQSGNTIAFTWASDSKSKPFSFRSNYRFTADFYLPTQGAIGSPTTYKWVMGSTECPQTTQSPKVTAVRSTGG